MSPLSPTTSGMRRNKITRCQIASFCVGGKNLIAIVTTIVLILVLVLIFSVLIIVILNKIRTRGSYDIESLLLIRALS